MAKSNRFQIKVPGEMKKKTARRYFLRSAKIKWRKWKWPFFFFFFTVSFFVSVICKLSELYEWNEFHLFICFYTFWFII